MLRLTLKSLTLGSMVALSTTTSVFAQVPVLQNLRLAQAPSFSCGSHVRTYTVKSLDNRRGFGIRCVKFSEGRPGETRIPRLAWYGEGNWSGATYRHVGQAVYRGSNLVGFASDIHGNGEDINNNFPGNLKVEILGSTIRVTGAWNEEWQLVNATNYNPLPTPRTCGRYFDEYKVSDLTGSRRGEGLRCVLSVGPKNTTWFGNGNWGGSTYSHIGTRSVNGYGAGDVCGTNFGSICNTFSWGSLKLNSVPGGFNVTGAWSEKWR